ncbi:ABL176Wp [Eremothecium gossypii ATCC 10895]|uniref:ABL176Wp n=1 Tax=Eremothecium gossypii (strain ATCC 10895 / CBS 109.51 / FGSC 9923 / NRRL Y-1056) TaxID=284811 RepID=Q75E46_EREGS|nr:ABL176Wp [Eremothecium gossypii ATCC 10895]AAS50595.1 ABL176Wp [Eremothecium gossypii ATCC 10895]AEY94883.1 FABL176Wp [Eremothecium gossypii FDAG1]
MNHIKWPNEANIVPYKRPKTLQQITGLFYNAGFLFSAMYLLTSLILRPLLLRSHNQRLEMSYITLLRLRKLVNDLAKRLKTTPVTVIGFNERVAEGTNSGVKYVDRCSQTSQEDFEQANMHLPHTDPSTENWERINGRISQAITSLNSFAYENAHTLDHCDRFSFEAKLLADSLDQHRDTSFNKKCTEISDTIIELKSWFIRGSVPS